MRHEEVARTGRKAIFRGTRPPSGGSGTPTAALYAAGAVRGTLLALALLTAGGAFAAPVNIALVKVGDVANLPDPATGYGAVHTRTASANTT